MRSRRQFMGPGGTRRGKGSRAVQGQVSLFDPDDDDPDDHRDRADLGELARDIHRMTLETSSNVYAQRRAYW